MVGLVIMAFSQYASSKEVRVFVNVGLVAAMLLALTACSPSKSERAEKAYEMAKRAGATNTELCQRKQAIAEAYLEEENEEEYRVSKVYAEIECMNARYKPYLN